MDKMLIVRTLVLVVALINSTLVMAGYNPIPYTEEEVESFISSLFLVFATLWAWWKNNSITKEAREADKHLKELKGSGK